MKISAVLIGAAGILFVWSAIRGASVLGTLRDAVSHQPPLTPSPEPEVPEMSVAPYMGAHGVALWHTMTTDGR